MDNITHTLLGATLARTPLGRAGRGTTAALIIASNLPDIDIVTSAGGTISYLQWHRGPTHGPIGIIGLGLLTAAIVSAAYRIIDSRRRDPDAEPARVATFGMLAIVSTIGVLLHVLMDVPTSYGVRVLSPFSWRWFAVDWMPIIDIWLLIVLLAGLLFGLRSPAARRRNGAIVLTVMAVIYGVRAAAHHQALVLAPRLLGPTLPQPCDPPSAARSGVLAVWPRAPLEMPVLPAGKRCLVEIAAIPDFIGPFSWRIIAQMSNSYDIYQLDLLDARLRNAETSADVFWRHVRRYPNIWTPLVERAGASRLGRVFLGFSRFPAARSVVDAEGVTTVRWTDVRFVFGIGPVELPRRGPDMFTATVRIDADGHVVDQRLGSRR